MIRSYYKIITRCSVVPVFAVVRVVPCTGAVPVVAAAAVIGARNRRPPADRPYSQSSERTTDHQIH